MLTTTLNSTVWLLIATTVAAVVGAMRGREARDVTGSLVRYACAWPVLLVLTLLAGGGFGSRLVLGFLSPGAYAEEVVAARSFLDRRALYGADGRREMGEWLGGTLEAVPWAQVPGVTPCQASAFSERANFYTEHAHTPMLLLAGVPIVHVAGGRGLYVVLALLSIGAVIAMTAVMVQRAGLPWRSREALLILVAIAGWQPVLAGLRQGDAVLPAAGLVALAWHFAGRKRSALPAVASAIASCIALPAVGVLLALARSATRAAAIAMTIVLAGVGATIAVAGRGVMAGFAQTMVETAHTYAGALPNYAVIGRFMVATNGYAAVVAMAIVMACSWWRARDLDASFASFIAAGLLAVPVLWSQHLALLFVPAAVLLTSVVAGGSSLRLAVLSLILLCASLPDGAVARILELAAPVYPFGFLPLVPSAIVIVWAWTTFSRVSRSSVAPQTVPVAAGVSH